MIWTRSTAPIKPGVKTIHGRGMITGVWYHTNWEDHNRFEVQLLVNGKKFWCKREEILETFSKKSVKDVLNNYIENSN